MASRVQFLIGAKVTMNDKEDTSSTTGVLLFFSITDPLDSR